MKSSGVPKRLVTAAVVEDLRQLENLKRGRCAEVKDPEKKGRETVTVKSAKLGADGRSVEIELEDFRPVNQIEIKFQLKAKDGTPIEQEFQCTVNAIPGSVAAN